MNIAAHSLLIQAYELAEKHRFADVVRVCEQLTQLQNITPQSLFVEGFAAYHLGQIDAGLAKMEQAISHHKDFGWIETLGGFYQKVGYPQAYDAYRLALEVKPDGLPESFNRLYYDAMLRTQSAPFPLARRQRFALLVEHFEATLNRTDPAGWVAECGCFRGLSTHVLASVMAKHQSGFDGSGMVVCDSFEGLGQVMPQDHIPDDYPDATRLRQMTKPGHFAAPQEMVMQHLSDFPNIRWVKGWIPESLASLPDDARYRFVNVDVDMYEPTSGAFCYFWPKLLPGGIIISDDYNWPGAHKAINDLVASLPDDSYHFDTNEHGQAWLEKP